MYLDPGFGGMLIQIIVPIIAVGGALVFSFRRKIRQLFSRDDARPVDSHDVVTDADDDAVDVLND